ncbi:MAG: hypothetical protein SWQ30_12315 [Thermodesulfobacteriota bacterium]|nr:hypothetical protein [Thermodesulfobacteriota bacterium]
MNVPERVGMNMEWTITLKEEDKYVEIVTSGIADREGSLNMAKAIATALSKLKIKKILIDHRAISRVSGRTVEVYRRPTEFKGIGVIQGIRVAEVVKPEHKEFFGFLETVCVNRGYIFSVFDDQKPALEWLLKS